MDLDGSDAPIPPDDDEDEFADHDPTLADCVRLWHQAIEWFKHDTLYGVVEFAGISSQEKPVQRATWIESVQRVREAGLFDIDTSWYLIWSVVETAYEAEDVFEDPIIGSISDRMTALCRAHGLDDCDDFTTTSYKPPEWDALLQAWEEREAQLKYDMLEEAGEHAMVAMLRGQPAEFERRRAAVEVRVRRDFAAERERWMPLDAAWTKRLALD